MEPVNLTKIELDDLKRKVDQIALNVTNIAKENERLVRSQEQWAANFSDRQKVLDVTAKLTIENDKVKLLEAKVQDSAEEIKNYQDSLQKQAGKITSLELEKQAAVSRGDGLAVDLSNARRDCIAKGEELVAVIAGFNNRLAHFLPQGILDSKIGSQIMAFDASAAIGDQPSLRVMAGLSQLRAAFIPGSGPDDKLVAVKSIGLALYAAWSSQSKDAKEIHALFAEWQNFLNNLPGPGYQLVVPDLGQNVPQNVTAPAGVAKVSEVQLWIVKGDAGSIYSRGIVR